MATHLERVYAVADDAERVVLDRLAVRAGIMRECECHTLVIAGRQCVECGRVPQRPAH